MVALNKTYDTKDIPEGDGDFQPLPAGWYEADIGSVEMRTTKAGTGEYAAVRFNITGPTHAGRVVFSNYNLRNPNPATEGFAEKEFKRLGAACGIATIDDTDQLVGGQCRIKLTVRTGEYSGNEVKGYAAITGSVPPGPKTDAPKEPIKAPW